MALNRNLLLLMAFIHPASAMALDASCAPMLSASEARLKQAAWHSSTVVNGNFKIEHMKVSGSFFQHVGGAWAKSPVSFDETEKSMISQIKSGEIKLTNCSSGNTEVVEGVQVYAFKSKIEMQGAPAKESTLYIGKADGLPYKQVGKDFTVKYKYKDISAPKL